MSDEILFEQLNLISDLLPCKMVFDRNPAPDSDLAAASAYFEDNAEEPFICGSWSFFPVRISQGSLAVYGLEADPEQAKGYAALISFHLGEISEYRHKQDPVESFWRDVITEKLSSSNLQVRAEQIGIINEVPRTVFLIETAAGAGAYTDAMEIVSNLFPERDRDYILPLDQNTIVLLKEISDKDAISDFSVDITAKMIEDTLSSEAQEKVTVSVGRPAAAIIDVIRSYREARTAREIGRIFYSGSSILDYSRLGMARLIYQLPPQECVNYLQETFRSMYPNDLDEELMNTIKCFFENNLNVSETARQLYVHRNTLVYRLDKVLRQTGLDLRNFSDAVQFQVALLIWKYIRVLQEKE